MSDHNDPGMGEKLKGTAKEAAGKMTGSDDLEREGEAQQKKAQKADEAARLEEEAQHKRNQQKGHEGEQTKHQN